jgi:hypothetical protein
MTEPMLGRTLTNGTGKRNRTASGQTDHSSCFVRARRRTEDQAWRREEGIR